MAIQLITTLLGLGLLAWSTHRLIDGTLQIAHQLRAPPVIVALTAVAMGTSAPELMVAVSASLRGIGEIAVGNALGSNLANIGLVLGVTALFSFIPIDRNLVRREIPLLVLVTLVAGWCLRDFHLSPADGLLLTAMLGVVLGILVWSHAQTEAGAGDLAGLPKWRPAANFLLGLILLVGSSELLVWSCSGIATQLGVSDLIIGLTIVAVGTSLPELTVSVVSIMRREHGVAMGTIVGSNIFNLLAVMAVPAILSPLTLEPDAFYRDYLYVLALTALLAGSIYIVYALARRGGAKLGTWVGLALLVGYIGYYALLARTMMA